MKISIFERFNPFSHKAGVRCLVPGTRQIITAFPAKINDETVDVEAPIKEWTVFQDLERAQVLIRGIGKQGAFTRQISGTKVERKPKLSFGIHKAQNMEKVVERCDPAEFLPLWYALAQHYPSPKVDVLGDSLLGEVQNSDRLQLHLAWKNLFLAGFTEWMIPRATDEGFHGFAKPPIAGGDPFQLFSNGAVIIQEMFVRWDGTSLYILPRLPPELHCGRLTDLQIPGLGEISLEWSKKEIKKIILTPEINGDLAMIYPKQTQSFRVKTGDRSSRQTIEKPLQLQKNVTLFFDQFQH